MKLPSNSFFHTIANDRGTPPVSPDPAAATAGQVTRREVVRKTIRIGAVVVLAHFALLAAGCDDKCPGGNPADDKCTSDNADECPGSAPPIDECPANGNRKEDICEIGLAAADTCDPKTPESDQCDALMPPDDLCDASTKPVKLDSCGTGVSPDDQCDPTGTTEQGDSCPGGDPDGGLDTCTPEGSGPANGDDCSPGSFGTKDDCKKSHPDECTLVNDDMCPAGTNSPSGDGPEDYCQGALGSDQCNDGTDAQDVCSPGKTDYGLYDVCPGGGKDVDKCVEGSTDYCMEGKPDSDECVVDQDECPGGLPSVDECPTGASPEDICTSAGGCAGGDAPEKGQPDPDKCTTADVCSQMDIPVE